MTDTEFELCTHVCPRCGSCDRCCDGQCRSNDETRDDEPEVTAWAILGIDPDFTGPLSTSEYVGRMRRRSSDESEQR